LVIDRVRVGGERLVITRHGTDVAGLVPMADVQYLEGSGYMTVTVDANKLVAELREKHDGDLDAVMRELTQLLQAASTATALVEQERQRRMTGDHK
jgi:prevent-host-death family protein